MLCRIMQLVSIQYYVIGMASTLAVNANTITDDCGKSSHASGRSLLRVKAADTTAVCENMQYCCWLYTLIYAEDQAGLNCC